MCASQGLPVVLFEDNDIVALIKPAGVVVNRAESVEGKTLQDWIEQQYPALFSDVDDEVFLTRSGIAHRLDKETSGVMIMGKHPEALQALMSQFKERTTSKEYVALVHGGLQPETGTINLPLGRSVYNRHRFCVDVFGKASVTGYKVEQYIGDYSLVRLYPKTGRTHQIRVHMAHIGHPLVADEVYGGRKRSVRDRLWCPRHFLHAAVLEIMHPVSGEQLRFEAALPDDLKGALDAVSRI
jgi:23S rRNA pseudouridine1911/1915/1917 synthase